MKQKTINVAVDESLWQLVRKQAYLSETSMSEAVRVILREKLEGVENATVK